MPGALMDRGSDPEEVKVRGAGASVTSRSRGREPLRLAMTLALSLRRRRRAGIPCRFAEARPDQDDRLMSEVGFADRIVMLGKSLGQPRLKRLHRVGAAGDDPVLDVDRAARVLRKVVRAAAELGRAPVPAHDHAACQARKFRRIGEADDEVEVPYPTLSSQVVLCGALSESDDADPLSPAKEAWVAIEEPVQVGVSGPPEPFQVGRVDRLG
jgi:hypothetical protein